jgi:serine/threonine-protein kinase
VAKLLDFGLAKPVQGGAAVDLSLDAAITGSPLYLAPEQAIGDSEPDARTDIYALGAVAFFLLTGRPPFVSDRAVRVIVAHAHDAPPSPREFAPQLAADLEGIILKALAKRPEHRYQSADELAEALENCSAAGTWTADDAERWWSDYAASQSAEELVDSAR